MKEKRFIKKKHVVSFNLLAISCAMFFTGCNKDLDDAVMEKMPSETNPSTVTTKHVDCLHQRWYEGSEFTKAYDVSDGLGIDFTDVLKYIGEKVASGAFGKLGGFGAEQLIAIFIQDKTQAKLDEILNKLGDIQKSIEALTTVVKLANYDGAFREKETMYINLQSKTVDTWLTLQSLDKNKTLSSEERILRRKEVVKKWGESNINGAGSANYATINFAKKIMSLAAEQKNYFQIYDEYALKYFGFEQESFAWRENCRDREITLLAIAFSLSNMYENLINTPDDVSSLAQTVSSMEKFATTYKVSHETYNAGINICYIPEMFGRKFNRDLRLIPYNWYNSYPKVHERRKISVFVSDLQNYCTSDNKCKLMSQRELGYIYKFYDSRSNQKRTFEDILGSAGFKGDLFTSNKKEYMISSDGAFTESERWYNNNYIVNFRGVSLNDKDWISGHFRLGIMYCMLGDTETMVRWDTAPNAGETIWGLLYFE